MVDGGRMQTCAAESGPGVVNPAWRELPVACCQTLSTRVHAADPQPEPSRKFLDPVPATRLAVSEQWLGWAWAGQR